MSWSLSRSRRFDIRHKSNNSEYVVLPSTLNARATGIGFGKRWQPHNVYGMDSPPPGTYNLPVLANTKGTKFSLSESKDNKGRFLTPGPGAYDHNKPFEKFTEKITLKSRITRNTKHESPPPGAYNPVLTLTQYNGFKNISFGIGPRTNLENSLFDGPGPGAYEMQSKFGLKS